MQERGRKRALTQHAERLRVRCINPRQHSAEQGEQVRVGLPFLKRNWLASFSFCVGRYPATNNQAPGGQPPPLSPRERVLSLRVGGNCSVAIVQSATTKWRQLLQETRGAARTCSPPARRPRSGTGERPPASFPSSSTYSQPCSTPPGPSNRVPMPPFLNDLKSLLPHSSPPPAKLPSVGSSAPLPAKLGIASYTEPTIVACVRHCGCPFAESEVRRVPFAFCRAERRLLTCRDVDGADL